MRRFRLGSLAAVLVTVQAVVGCGEGADVSSSRSVEEAPAESPQPDAASGGAFALTTDQARAITMIAIDKPWCKVGGTSSSREMRRYFCSGTVISDRFVLTAAHCLVSQCAAASETTSAGIAARTVQMANVRIPSAPGANLNGFDWNGSVLKARNFDFVQAPNNRAFDGTMTYSSGTETADFPNTIDMAVIDFGAGALSGRGYPALPYFKPNTSYLGYIETALLQGYTDYEVAGYSQMMSATGDGTIALNAASNLGLRSTYTALSGAGAIVNSPARFGCFGESGSPLLRGGKIVGVVATAGGISQAPGTVATEGGMNCQYVQNGAVYGGSRQFAAGSVPFEFATDYSTGPIRYIMKKDYLQVTMNALTAVSTPPTGKSYSASAIGNLQTAAQNPRAGFIASYATSHVNAGAWSRLTVPSYLTGGVVDSITATGSGAKTSTWTVTGLAQGYYKVEMFYPANSGNSKCVAVQFQTHKEGTWSGTAPNYKWTPTSWKTFKTRVNQTTGDANSGTATVSGWTPKMFNMTKMKSGGTNVGTYVFVSNNKSNGVNTGRLSVRVNDLALSGCASARMVADTIRLTLIQSVLSAPTTTVNSGI
jgi:hypothetical protein